MINFNCQKRAKHSRKIKPTAGQIMIYAIENFGVFDQN